MYLSVHNLTSPTRPTECHKWLNGEFEFEFDGLGWGTCTARVLEFVVIYLHPIVTAAFEDGLFQATAI